MKRVLSSLLALSVLVCALSSCTPQGALGAGAGAGAGALSGAVITGGDPGAVVAGALIGSFVGWAAGEIAADAARDAAHYDHQVTYVHPRHREVVVVARPLRYVPERRCRIVEIYETRHGRVVRDRYRRTCIIVD
jgi:osmotically inducible lipoprotein OsmB